MFPSTLGISISTKIVAIINIGKSEGKIFFINKLTLKFTISLKALDLLKILIIKTIIVKIIVKEYNFCFIFHLISCYNYIGEVNMIEEKKIKTKFKNLKTKLINFFKNPKEVISFF